MKIIISFLWILIISICTGQAQGIEHYTVFKAGEEGYHTYRIPAIAQAQDGTLIAIAEGRRDKSSDPGDGHIDIVYKLSCDGGQTWSPLLTLEKSKEGWSASNPTVIVQNKGRILAFYDIWKPGRGQNQENCRLGKPDNQVWFRTTDDNGKTWSKAKDITRQARDYKNWNSTVLGPGHGIETSTGQLVLPGNAQYISDDNSVRLGSFALYSNDGGKNWERGQPLGVRTSENQIVELNDGRLMINARQKDRSGKRVVAISSDRGKTWGEPTQGQSSPPIAAGIIRYPRQDKSSLLLWCGPQTPKERTNLTLRLSSDQGISFPAELLVCSGPAAYSDITCINNGDVGILWEGGNGNAYEKILFTRIQQNIILNLDSQSSEK